MIRGNFLIRKATKFDYGLIRDCFKKYYWPTEILTTSMNISKEPTQIEEECTMEIVKNCTNLLAFDMERNYENPIGFISSGRYTLRTSDEHLKIAENVQDKRLIAIEKLSLELEKKCNIFKKYNVNEGLYIYWFGVSPEYGRKSLASNLMEVTFDLAKEMGYKICFGDASSEYSKRASIKVGMELAGSIDYKDFLDENGKQVFKPLSPHTSLYRLIKVLK